MPKNQHILIIRLSAMGDVAMTVPVISAFINQHPTCRITVLSKAFFYPLFKDLPNVAFYAADVKGKHKGLRGLYRLSTELKSLGITHIADFHQVLRSKILRMLLSKSAISVAVINKGRKEKRALTRKKNAVRKQLKTTHQRYADVLGALGFPTAISHPQPLEKTPLPKHLNDWLGIKDTPWIGIAPFAAYHGKMYPLDLMKEVMTTLPKDFKILLFGGGEKEIAILKTIEATSNHIVNVAGRVSLEEELRIIAHLDVMLSMDSGNAHLAAMQHVKTITLWGVTHPYAGFAPFNQPADYCILPDLKQFPRVPSSIYGNVVFKGYENVMKTIAPDMVVQKIQSILAE